MRYFRNIIRRLAVLLILFLVYSELKGQINDFRNIKWKTERIAPGLTWKTAHAILNDSVNENINVLLVNLHKRKITIAYNPTENQAVSRQAVEKLALAAVNGGFFNVKEGGSVTYLKTGGLIIDADTAQKWSTIQDLNGSILIEKNGYVTIEPAKPNHYYNSHPEFQEVLVTGPLLIHNREKTTLIQTPLVTKRHPRTSAGILGKHFALLVTVDGRTDQARGMTLSELADLMVSLHCTDAVNLDGGGSTTMWINGKPFNGVVNMPCDNKKFDHEGERAVSDILIVK